MQNFKMAIIQDAYERGAVERNLKKIERQIRQAKEKDAEVKLILFPELAVTGYDLSLDIRKLAEARDGSAFREISRMAMQEQVYVAYGYAEKGGDGKVYNSLQLVDEQGHSLANYRKIHTTNLEKEIFAPGDDAVSVETPLGTIGLLICWDLAFPELSRLLALRGAQLLLAPAAWEKPFDDPFIHFARARALDNTIYLAACNHTGGSGQLSFFGKSALYGPTGQVLASAEGEEPGIMIGEIRLAELQEERSDFYTMLKERRTDLYSLKGEVDRQS